MALFAVLGAVTLPSVGTASPPRPVPTAAEDDDCAKSKVEIEIDALTGEIFVLDDGSWLPSDGVIDVYLGELDSVVVVLTYTQSEWEVEITHDDGETETRRTKAGVLRHAVSGNDGKLQLSSTELSSTMTTMTPVVPDVIIRPKKTCPPPT